MAIYKYTTIQTSKIFIYFVSVCEGGRVVAEEMIGEGGGGGEDRALISGHKGRKTYEPSRGKTNNVVSEQVRHKPTCTSTEAG